MEKYPFFNCVKFTKDDKTGYYLNSTIRKRLHRYVWEYYNGEIPKGYHVHHIDHDKSNNDISNLTILKASDHTSLHSVENGLTRYDELVENLNKNARPKAIEWHKSEEGRKWHSKHAKEVLSNLENREYVCIQCGKTYETSPFGPKKFCSNNCKSKWRRENGLDDEKRQCQFCNKEFIVNKYSKTRFCSRSCSKKNYWESR
ncbi:HNH endonuclease signature motif containing protein [Bacillus swezeyi]|uniref:HNH endonuclease signature motif containing protein n=1 Tax=Bacillus swezeyi TaxID=1925020 RepID=UPI0039C76339